MCQPCTPCGLTTACRAFPHDLLRPPTDAMSNSQSRDPSEDEAEEDNSHSEASDDYAEEGDNDSEVEVEGDSESNGEDSDQELEGVSNDELQTIETQKAERQAEEKLEHPPYTPAFDKKGRPCKPMVEVLAGGNVWWQGTVVKESLNEIKVWVPGAGGRRKDGIHTWINKRSNRIWRGSLNNGAWAYHGDGSWYPKNQDEGSSHRGSGKRGRKATKSKRRQAVRGGAGLSEGEATGLSIDVESGMDEEASVQRRPSRFARRVDGCEPRRPPRVEALARGSGEEQHSTSEVVDIVGNSCDRREDSSLSDRQNGGQISGRVSRDCTPAPSSPPLPSSYAWWMHHLQLLDEKAAWARVEYGVGAEAGALPSQIVLWRQRCLEGGAGPDTAGQAGAGPLGEAGPDPGTADNPKTDPSALRRGPPSPNNSDSSASSSGAKKEKAKERPRRSRVSEREVNDLLQALQPAVKRSRKTGPGHVSEPASRCPTESGEDPGRMRAGSVSLDEVRRGSSLRPVDQSSPSRADGGARGQPIPPRPQASNPPASNAPSVDIPRSDRKPSSDRPVKDKAARNGVRDGTHCARPTHNGARPNPRGGSSHCSTRPSGSKMSHLSSRNGHLPALLHKSRAPQAMLLKGNNSTNGHVAGKQVGLVIDVHPAGPCGQLLDDDCFNVPRKGAMSKVGGRVSGGLSKGFV